MAYTSNTEFDLVKRVQITNEVPPISLWHTLPSALKNDFWKYVVGVVETESNVNVISQDFRPQKTVNGTVAPTYGPPVPATPNYENPEQFHSLSIEGVIAPEFDFILHELYRYLDSIYPDHPDYDRLLTPLELNEMFRAAAAIIGYTPNYTFLENWSRSINGAPMSAEEIKWKIRDLRSLAFRRKFFGSYQGYKMLFSSIHRHGSVYITGTYRPYDGSEYDPTDPRADRKFRLIDYFGVNDTVYKERAQIAFKGLIVPSDTAKVYHYTYHSTLAIEQGPLSRVSLGAFLYKEGSTSSNVVIQTTEVETSETSSSNQIHYLRISAPLHPTLRTYEIRTEEAEEPRSIQATPSPRHLGLFELPLFEAIHLYPNEPVPIDSLDAIPLLQTHITPEDDVICDEYIEEIFTYRDCAQVEQLQRGYMTFTIEPERSPILITPPVGSDPRYGVEIDTRRYVESATGVIEAETYAVFLQGTLAFTIDSTGRPTAADMRIAAIPDVNPISGLDNRGMLFDVDQLATITIGATVRFVSYDAETNTWGYMYGYEGWVDTLNWGSLHAVEIARKNDDISPQPFSTNTFEAWKSRAASAFVSDAVAADELEVYGEIDSNTPKRVMIPNSQEALKLNMLSTGDQVRGPGIPIGTVITQITSDFFDISNDSLRFGLTTFTIYLRSTRNIGDVELSQFKTDLHTLYPEMSSSLFTAMWPSRRWPEISNAYLEGLKDASLFQPLAVERVTDNPSRVTFDKSIFLEMTLDRVLRHPNSAGFRMGATHASLMDVSWMEYIESFLSMSRRATEDVRLGTQLTLTTDRSGLYSIIPGNKYTDPAINARFITIPYTYSQDSTPAYLQLGIGGHTAERERLFTSVSDLLRPPLYGTVFYDDNRDTSDDPESISVKRRGVYASALRQRAVLGGDTDNNVVSNDHLDSPLFEIPLGEHEYAEGIASPDLPGNSHQIIQASVYLEQFNNVPLKSELVVNSPYITKGEQLPRDLYRFRGRWTASLNESSSTEDPQPIWPQASDDNPFQERDYFLVSTTASVGTYTYNAGDWLIYIGGEWVRRQWLVLGEWPPSGEEAKEIYLSPSKVELQGHLAPLGLSIRDALDKYFIYFIASRDLNLLDKLQEGDDTANVIEVKRHDWIILTRETYVDDVVNNLRVRMIENGDDYLLISPPDGGHDRGDWAPIIDPDDSTQPLWPDTSTLSNLDYFHITENATIGDWEFQKHDYIQITITVSPNPDPNISEPIQTINWRIQRYSYVSWTEYQPWLVAGGMTYEIIRQSFDRSILAPSSFNTITNQRAELIDSTLQTLDLPRRFISRGSCNFELKIDPEFYATDVDGVRFSLTEGPIYWDRGANRFYVNNQDASGSYAKHYIQFQEPIYFKNLLSVVGTVFADTPNEIHVYTGHEFDANQLSLTDRVESGNYIYVRNEYEEALENQFYSHYITAYGEVDFTEPDKIKPVAQSPLAEEREEEFRLAVLGIQPKDDRASEIRAITPTIIRSYEERFENKFFRNLLMLGGRVKRDDPTMILPLGNDVASSQAFADAMAELNPGDYIEALYITTGKTYRYALDVLLSPDQEFNTISYGPGSWLAAGTSGALVMNYDDPEGSWEQKTLPVEWSPTVPINTSIFSHNLNMWWIFGTNSHIAHSYDNGAQWLMFTEPDDWANDRPNITCVAGSNPSNEDNVPNILVIGTDDGRVAYFDEAEASPLWIPSPLPIEGSFEEEPDEGETGADDEEGIMNPEPPLLSGWGDLPVFAVGFNPSTNTWIVGGSEGKIARTNDITGPTRDPDDTEADPTLPTTQWTLLELPTDWMLSSITSIQCMENTWVIGGQVGELGVIAYSIDDGDTWNISQLKTDEGLDDDFGVIYQVAWKPGEWVATSNQGTMYTSAYDNDTNADVHELANWVRKPAPNIPNVELRAMGLAGDTLVVGGDDPSLFIISNTTRPADSLQIREVNRDESVFNIVTDADIVNETDWEEDMEVEILFAIRTLRSIPDSLVGLPADGLTRFTNPRTRQLYLESQILVESPDEANRVYMPRMNEFLLEPFLVSGDDNEEYIGANGYPTFEESPALYDVTGDNPSPWTNDALLPLHHCDSDGHYINDSGVPLSTAAFTEQVIVDDGDEDPDMRIDKIDPRLVAWQPLYTTYYEWLEDGNDIEEADSPLDFDLSQATIVTTYNEQDQAPWIRISVNVEEAVLRPPYNGVSVSILPAEPVPIPLVGVPRYRTDQSGSNMGIVAATVGDEVFYSIEPLSNNVSLLATRGPNTGITASGGDEEGTYSLEPVQYIPSAFVTDEGSVIVSIKDDLMFYTVDDPDLTGLYFHPNGYGSWADKPSTNDMLPWENDPNAFVGFDENEDGLNDKFVYLQNTRHDPIYLVDQMGRRLYDESGEPILAPAPKYLSYAGLLEKSGIFAEKEQLSLDATNPSTIIGVAQDNQSFELSQSIPLEESAFVRQVRLNLLTLASIETTEATRLDTRLIHKLSIRDMAKYEPDRVCYLGSAYPDQLNSPEMYEAGLFTNRNGAPVYAANELGHYVSSTEDYEVTTELFERIQPPQPLYYLCQDWFDNDYFVEGSEDNPYWQYLVFEDYLDHRSKEWRQRFGTYRKIKGELGREMTLEPVPDEDAYVTIYPGLEYVRDASSMIVRQTDYIQYRLGRINSVMVANPKYDRKTNPNVDSDNAKYGLNYQSVFHEATDQNSDPVDMFNDSQVVQTRLKGEWRLNYTLNTTKNFANPQDTRSSIVAVTELGVYNRNKQMIAYATFPPVIYDSAKHHMSVNLLIKQGEFTPLSD